MNTVSGVRLRQGEVTAVCSDGPALQELVVTTGGQRARAVNYSDLGGRVAVGDRVLLNTTAMALGLGTGGVHFVVARCDQDDTELAGPGHAMKVRYTPVQVCCQVAEEPGGPGHRVLRRRWRLDGMPVVAAELHSQVPVVLAGIRSSLPGARLAYVFSDGGALPVAFSRLVPAMKRAGLVDVVIAAGQAFGGDLEAVNVPSALAVARHVVGCAAAVVAMGPGQLGTGTKLGFSGLEQADHLNRAAALGGVPVTVLRLSGADPRPRHRGVSHHSLTVLQLALSTCLVPYPRELAGARQPYAELSFVGVQNRHRLVTAAGSPALEYLARAGLQVTSMGRSPQADPWFFLAAGAAGKVAARVARLLAER
ncbi:MAG: DUF3866 family protein [Bacillota bacterium]